ncbi:MAG: RagB/SusD family nutrient uptake outer membrane protein [Pseudopedobacter saltans]|uniref:RagB/SusD family nutrient uptake outer membrane protein n=1 Tax=Pseudopedobacter saltans TaxID=151895 RepID=A0A2W5HEJ8_9SPHI|nr:MAG: RagB/SusD family nutrient uptake outer membrane protein [Pseudopedobacter saltans]
MPKSTQRIYFSTYLFIFLGLIGVTACNKQLEKQPESQLSDPTFWKNANDLKLAVNAIYSSLPSTEENAYDNRTDNTYGRARNDISDGSRVVTPSNADWTKFFAAIRMANNVMAKALEIKDDTAAVNKYVAEAYFFRGYFYFELTKRFGDIPLILRLFDETDTLVTAHRTNRKIVLDSAIKDLEYAQNILPKAGNQAVEEYGRITSGAATAIIARIGLFEGTWSKYHQNDEAAKSKYLDTAIAASQRLMNEKYYSLFQYSPKPDSSYFYLFQYAGEGPTNRENILVRLFGENISNSIASHTYTQLLDLGQACPTRSLVDAYLYKDGLPIDKSPLFKTQDSVQSEFIDRDPRLGMTVFNKNLWYVSSFYQPTFQNTLTGYKTAKYFISRDYNTNVSFVDDIVIRYGEILLTYAEALYEKNGNISDNDLNISINLLRDRAGMPHLTNAFVSSNGLSMQEEIRRERRVELAIESYSRYWDLIRWKIAETILPKAILGSKIFVGQQTFIPNNPPVTTDGYLIVQPSAQRVFNPQRDYLTALPTNDIGADPNLDQNPGW